MPGPLVVKGLDASRNRRIRIGAALVLTGLLVLFNQIFTDSGEDGPVTVSVDRKLVSIENLSVARVPEADNDNPDQDQHTKVVRTVNVRLRRGETPVRALTAAGVEPRSAGAGLAALGKKVNMRHLRPGRRFVADVNAKGEVVALKYPINTVEYYEATLNDGKYVTSRKELPTNSETVETACRIHGTLYTAFKECGLDRKLVPVVVDLLESQFDLFTDIREGDILRIIVQKESVNGHFLRFGRVDGLLYEGKIASTAVFMHRDQDGKVTYWDADGYSIEKPFIRTPVRYNGYTSVHSRRGLHPILHAYTPGRAVDYSARRGTPVRAVGDGKVVFAGRRGAHGNTVILKHADGIQTYYARLNSIKKGIRTGVQLNLGNRLGTVGSSGSSKGTYLHFAVAKDGEFVHPRMLSSRNGVAMVDPDRHDFLASAGKMTGRLRALPVRGSDIDR